jgi:signal recognition particle subunit SRP54
VFDSLSDRFDQIFTRLKGRGRLNDEDVNEVLGEIRLALLEADVNLEVIAAFLEAIRVRCTGAALSKSLSPAQQVIKVVNEELTAALGGEPLRIQYASRPPTVVLLAGLQGTGKTTAVAKLARWFRQQGRHPLLVGADLQRPAAVEQLRVLGKEVGASVYSEPTDPVAVARAGVAEAERVGRDVVIIDSAGRLAIDEELMNEIAAISAATKPHYTFLVVDAMTGQDALATAQSFAARLSLDGIILTKLDGDARGGAALSAKHVVGKPIAFASIGERVEDFEPFYPDRMASRILGMGDVLTLIERAEAEYDKQTQDRAVERLRAGRFSLEDFHDQLQQMKKLGPLQGILSMMPGLPKEVRSAKIEDKEVARIEAIIRSMTPAEKDDPSIIDGSRRQRIAAGSGTTSSDVNNLLRQFKEMQKLMRSSAVMGALNKGKGRKQKGGGRVTPSAKHSRLSH